MRSEGSSVERDSGGRSAGAWRARLSRAVRRAGVALVGVALLAGPASSGALADTSSPPTTRVIVTTTGGGSALQSLLNLNIAALTELPLVGGAVADVTPSQLAALVGTAGVIVSPDLPVAVASTPLATASARAPAATFPQSTGATDLVASGTNGHGVNVAVLDTGIDRLPDFSGRLVGGVDLSGEGNPFLDSYGHGTFVAGLIAGNGASSGGLYQGEAPGAGLISIKVADHTGATDIAALISGIGWAVANQHLFNISVLNISLGALPVQSTAINPLDRAVELAWHSGITVVASAGNGGPFNGTVLSPGDDPLVVTAGAIDDNGTATQADDSMATWSGVGPTNVDGWIKPDLVTSGRSVVSLRAPGSTIDTTYPSARIGAANFVGSGTSFSAAITSGAAALVVAHARAQGGLLGNLVGVGTSPDAIKAKLLGSTTPGPVGNPFVDGHGQLNVASAASKQLSLNQSLPVVAVDYGATVSLSGTWAASSWNPANWSGGSWNGGSWNGGSWNGGSWNGGSWNGAYWNGGSWNGGSWNSASWTGGSWNGGSWNGGSWNGGSWNGGSWNGGSWNGGSWNGGSWNGGSWNGGSWNGGSWNGGSWNSSDWS